MLIHITPHHLTLSGALQPFAACKFAGLGGMVCVDAEDMVLRFDRSAEADLYIANCKVVEKSTPRLHQRKTRWHARRGHRTRATAVPASNGLTAEAVAP